MEQLAIDFTHPHNNRESELMFDANIEHFSKQCDLVYNLLKSGKKLTTMSAMAYGIGDLRRRIKDLKDIHHIEIKSEFVGQSRFKQYYI